MKSNVDNDAFAEIRPYLDHEVQPVLTRLLDNRELIKTLTVYRFPKLSQIIPEAMCTLVRFFLKRKIKSIRSVVDFQLIVAPFMAQMIKRTTTELTWSGIEHLQPGTSYLFISNHRDIAVDPALVNWVLHKNGHDTVQIAIGSNLLQKPYISDLMRLNKSFIVKRGEKGKTLLTSLKQLSEYIHSCLCGGQSIWIAQREGRAKDGNDITDPAILKMLHIAKRKQGSFSQVMNQLKIVPVTLSYEFDPCDVLKAEELATWTREGHYEKADFEDIASIVRGIQGEKGSVHVAFGQPLRGKFEDAESLAAEIDKQLHHNYKLHPANLIAAGIADNDISPDKKAQFNQRLERVTPDVQGYMMQMYAYPYHNQQRARQSS